MFLIQFKPLFVTPKLSNQKNVQCNKSRTSKMCANFPKETVASGVGYWHVKATKIGSTCTKICDIGYV